MIQLTRRACKGSMKIHWSQSFLKTRVISMLSSKLPLRKCKENTKIIIISVKVSTRHYARMQTCTYATFTWWQMNTPMSLKRETVSWETWTLTHRRDFKSCNTSQKLTACLDRYRKHLNAWRRRAFKRLTQMSRLRSIILLMGSEKGKAFQSRLSTFLIRVLCTCVEAS